MVHITSTIEKYKNTKLASHTALQSSCWHIINTERSKIFQQRPNYNVRSSPYRDPDYSVVVQVAVQKSYRSRIS